MGKTNNSKEYILITQFERFYPILHKEGRITKPTRDAFMEEYIGISKHSWKNFRIIGIAKRYQVILELLNKVYPKE